MLEEGESGSVDDAFPPPPPPPFPQHGHGDAPQSPPRRTMDLRAHFARSRALVAARVARDGQSQYSARHHGVPLSRSDAEQLHLQRWQLWGSRSVARHGSHCVAWLPDGESLTCVADAGAVLRLGAWRLADSTWDVLIPATGDGSPLNVLRWRNGVEGLAVSHSSARLGCIDVHPSHATWTWYHALAVTTLQDAVHGSACALHAGGRDGALYSWDRRCGDGAVCRVAPPSHGSGGSVVGLHAAADGNLLVSISQLGDILTWDVRSMAKPLKRFPLSGTHNVASALYGTRVAVQARDGTGLVRDLVSQRAVELPAPSTPGHVCALSFLPHSRYVASATGRQVRLMDACAVEASQRAATCVVELDEQLAHVACHPGGECLAFSLANGFIGFVGIGK